MKITILQTDTVWASPAENIARAEQLMQQAGETDLYVLPEMWATGFAVDPQGVAEAEDSSEALSWMRQQAAQRQCALSGSLAVRVADGTFRNRHYFVTPQQVAFYDKHHLFTHGGEQCHYTAGAAPVVAQWQCWRLLLLTCYDLRFPVFARYGRSGLFYDAIVCVANWPRSREHAWQVLAQARAMENQCYVAAANRVGSDPVCEYGGGSLLIDPLGRPMAQGGAGEEALTALWQLERLQHARQRFRVLDDRDTC